MICVNHSGVNATAYCQNCGKGFCAGCINAGALRNLPGGEILCAGCIAGGQNFPPPYAAMYPQVHHGGPNPPVAAVLGLIPGVGAMYNGQFIKGLIHVVVFAVLIGVTDHYSVFGILIAAWILYQSFEAYHTARALREGQPPPDPLGLNEIGNWFNPGKATRQTYPEQTGPEQGTANSGSTGQYPFTPPATDFANPASQSIPPAPPMCWRHKEPIGAVVLIALGVLFLLGELDIFSGRLFEFAWPVVLIALGVWLIVRRFGDSHGGSK